MRLIGAAFACLIGCSAVAQDAVAPFDRTEPQFRAALSRELRDVGGVKSLGCSGDAKKDVNSVCLYSFGEGVRISLVSRLPAGKPHEVSLICAPKELVSCVIAVAAVADAIGSGWSRAQIGAALKGAMQALPEIDTIRFEQSDRILIAQNVVGTVWLHIRKVVQ